VTQKGAYLEDKLKYWHEQVENTVDAKFKEQNTCLLEQHQEMQQDMAA